MSPIVWSFFFRKKRKETKKDITPIREQCTAFEECRLIRPGTRKVSQYIVRGLYAKEQESKGGRRMGRVPKSRCTLRQVKEIWRHRSQRRRNTVSLPRGSATSRATIRAGPDINNQKSHGPHRRNPLLIFSAEEKWGRAREERGIKKKDRSYWPPADHTAVPGPNVGNTSGAERTNEWGSPSWEKRGIGDQTSRPAQDPYTRAAATIPPLCNVT